MKRLIFIILILAIMGILGIFKGCITMEINLNLPGKGNLEKTWNKITKNFREGTNKPNENDRYFVHTLLPGETLIELENNYGVSWQKIKAYNHIQDERRLIAGESIRIPLIE